jgi:hypothetical protein
MRGQGKRCERPMVFVSVPRLRIRSIFYLPQFFWYALRSRQQAQRAAGRVAGCVLRERRNAFWTMTAWESARATEAFCIQVCIVTRCPGRSSGATKRRSCTGPRSCVSEEAYKRLVKDGRPSKVRHLSAAHLAHQFPSPRPGFFLASFRPTAEAEGVSVSHLDG